MVNQPGIEVDLQKPSIDRQDVELKGGEVRKKNKAAFQRFFFFGSKKARFFFEFFF